MKVLSSIAGAVLLLLVGSFLAVGCTGGEPKGVDAVDPEAPQEGEMEESAKKLVDPAAEGVDAVDPEADDAEAKLPVEGAAETVTGVSEEAQETLDEAFAESEGNPDPVADAAEAAGEAIAGDLAHPDGLNRFAPGGKISDADLGGYWTSMTIAIDGKEVGTMTFDLWPESAPITVRNHLRLVDEGFYDGLGFHRIIRSFMAQGGDPRGDGTGNSPHGTIQAEFSRDPERSHEYGVLSMARTQMPNTASSQFFIITDNAGGRQLNGQYASFGRLTSGVDVLEAIANVPVVSGGREVSTPSKKVVITDAEVHAGEPPTGEVIQRPR